MKIENIPNLTRFETKPRDMVQKELMAELKPQYTHDEIYGEYCNTNIYIKCPLEKAFEYASNVYSLEEWTYSVRELKETSQKDIFFGLDVLADNTYIYVKCDSYPGAHVVDYLCAWDQGEELWMRYYLRFFDAHVSMQKPGTIVSWLNCRHPYYNREPKPNKEHVMRSQQRTDRQWVGDFWPFFPAGHRMEMNNLKAILEARFGF